MRERGGVLRVGRDFGRGASIALALGLAAVLLALPAVLGGCNTVQDFLTTEHDPGTSTTTVSGTAQLPGGPLEEQIVGVIVAPNDVNILSIDASVDATPVPTTSSVSPAHQALLEQKLLEAEIFNSSDEYLSFFQSTGPVSVSDGQTISVSVVQSGPFGAPVTSPQLGFGGTTASDLDSPPLDTFVALNNPAAFLGGADPDIVPPDASAWKIVNPPFAHVDGPFALPGHPNPAGYPVVSPAEMELLLGPHWSDPDICDYIHAHGFYSATPPHFDPEPHCAHGWLVYLPELSVGLLAPPDQSVILGGSTTTMTAAASSPAGPVSEVHFRVDGGVVATDTDGTDGFSGSWIAPIPTATQSFALDAVAVDSSSGASSTSEFATVFVPGSVVLDTFLLEPPDGTVVLQGATTTTTALVTAGTPPIQDVTFLANGVTYSIDLSGIGGGLYEAEFIAPSVTVSEVFELTARARDSVGATALSAPIEVTVAGPETAPVVLIIQPLPGEEFAFGASVDVSTTASGGFGGLDRVAFSADSTELAVDTDGSDGFSITWVAGTATATAGAAGASPGSSVSLTATAFDTLGQSTVSAPVVVTVLGGTPIPTLGLWALGGVAGLLVLVGVRARWRGGPTD